MVRPAGRRLLVAAVLLAASWALAPSPAAADPAGPTNARSRIVDVRPDPPGARVDVVGGDAFLQLTVEPGHEAIVPGYGGEPYLRFRTDGVVEVNGRSPATYVNGDRDGQAEVPPEADLDAAPDWERVAGDGTYAWHDHRIHWMTPDHPDRASWAVALDIDGRRVVVEGELRALSRPLPVGAVAVAVGAPAGVLLLDRRRHPASLAALTALTAGGVAVALGWGTWAAQPGGVGANPLVVAVPALATGVAAAALVGPLRRWRDVLVLAAVALVAGWSVLQLPALWHAVVPSELAAPAVRVGLGLVAGLVIAAGLLGVRPSRQAA